jgi:hypothetical protein
MGLSLRSIFKGSRDSPASPSVSDVADDPAIYSPEDSSAPELGRLLESLTGLVTLTPVHLDIIMEQKENTRTPAESSTLDLITSVSVGAEEHHLTSNADNEKSVTEMSIIQCLEEFGGLANEIKGHLKRLSERPNVACVPSGTEGKAPSTVKRVHPRLRRLSRLTSKVLDKDSETVQCLELPWRRSALRFHVWYAAFELHAYQEVARGIEVEKKELTSL